MSIELENGNDVIDEEEVAGEEEIRMKDKNTWWNRNKGTIMKAAKWTGTTVLKVAITVAVTRVAGSVVDEIMGKSAVKCIKLDDIPDGYGFGKFKIEEAVETAAEEVEEVVTEA